MAIYHLRLKVLGRALGRDAKPGGATRRSVVAAAAYRSGERLYDMGQERWFEFHKPDVVHTEILAPNGAPAWVFDRQALWNRVEFSEKRIDAQLMREVEITLPRELSLDEQIALVRGFVRDRFVSQGMVADIGIHCPDAADGREQPHAHVMLTMRRLDASTPTGFAATKERDWNEPEKIARLVAEARKTFNNHPGPENQAALDAAEAQRNVHVWRREWASYANAALAVSGSAERIDHRTLEAQGIARPPLPYFGLARHIEHAYAHLRERLTHWVAVKKRVAFYREAEHLKRRDPAQLMAFVERLNDLAEGFAASFRQSAREPPFGREAEHER